MKYTVSIIPPDHYVSSYWETYEAKNMQHAAEQYVNDSSLTNSGARVAAVVGGLLVVVPHHAHGGPRACGIRVFRVEPPKQPQCTLTPLTGDPS